MQALDNVLAQESSGTLDVFLEPRYLYFRQHGQCPFLGRLQRGEHRTELRLPKYVPAVVRQADRDSEGVGRGFGQPLAGEACLEQIVFLVFETEVNSGLNPETQWSRPAKRYSG
jgi:hypothetical protein